MEPDPQWCRQPDSRARKRNVTIRNELVAYVEAADPTYRWDRLGSRRVDGGTLHDLRLISQTWQGLTWTHRLHLYLPDRIASPEWAQLTIGTDYGGSRSEGQSAIDLDLASRIGIVSVHLYDIPNQPLFDGLREDELLAHTLARCLDTDDPTWPLLYPMVKAAVRAMDATADLCAEQKGSVPARFVVHGASKRGWTSWLSAVVDGRVGAIIPEVYDNLNLFAQMPHQMKVWNAYSEMIEDYTEQRLQDKMRTPRGHQIALTVDPYTYRQKLSLPKLLINSLSDRYWATDALTLYWDDMIGDKHVVYAPNQPHNIADRTHVRPTQEAFLRAVLCGGCLTDITADIDVGQTDVDILVRTSDHAIKGNVWIAASQTQDFRGSVWESRSLEARPGQSAFVGKVSRPATGCLALVAECLLAAEGEPFRLSTQVRILSSNDS